MSCATVISPVEILPADDLGRRRDWTDEEKIRIVEESLRGFRQGSATARRYGLSRSLLTRWRREYRSGVFDGAVSHCFVPLSISPPEAPPREAAGRPVSGGDVQITIDLVNGRRLTIPTALDPDILARLLPVLDAS